MRAYARTTVLSTVSVLLLWAIWRFGAIDFSAMGNAFVEHPYYTVACIAAQVVATLLAAGRYYFVARSLGIQIDGERAVVVTSFSTAAGQWMPGSLAFIEALRVGMMMRDRATDSGTKDSWQLAAGRLAAVSGVDRVMALGVLFVLAMISISLILWRGGVEVQHVGTLKALFATTGLLLAGTLALPHLAKVMDGRLTRVRFLHSLIAGAAEFPLFGRRSVSAFAFAIAVSIVAAGSTYLGARALSAEIPMAAIFGVLPILTVASIFPIGLAGLGGQQVVAVALFSIFALSTEIVGTTSLLVNLLGLIGNLLLAAIIGGIYSRKVKAWRAPSGVESTHAS